MKSSNSIFVFLLICFNNIFHAHTKQFAVLAATSKTWLNYGHQASVLHAYHTLIANGFPKENIITMFYDDIATDKRNPEPGVIRNHPQGKNVYENVKKDYTGERVTETNFLAILTGNSSMAEGPVIESSGSEDTLFIYIAGTGAHQYLMFPTARGIVAHKLVNTLESLTAEKKFDKVYVIAEFSYSAPIFDDISPTSKIFAVTAKSIEERPHFVYCFPEKKLCYGSLLGVAWTQYSDRLRQLKSGAKRTLYDQFNHVRAATPLTHVNMYGDLSVGQSELREFLGYKHTGKSTTGAFNTNKLGLAMPNHILSINENGYNQPGFKIENHINNYDHLLDDAEKYTLNKNRDFIKETMKNIFHQLRSRGYENITYEQAAKNRLTRILSEHHSDIYEKAIQKFHELCINIKKNPFTLQEISKLAHLCDNGVSLDDLTTAMAETCTRKHRLVHNVY